MDRSTAKALGIVSIVLGALTAGIQLMGGLCCGWIGWPGGIASVILGILAMAGGEMGLGGTGIALSVIVFILQITSAGSTLAGLGSGH